MIPIEVVHYLKHHAAPFQRHTHAPAATAQQLAHALHVSGKRVAKTVVVSADGKRWLAVLPAMDRIDTERLAEVLGAREVTLCSEASCTELFPGCELGAEPPFGHLYNLPVVLDGSLVSTPWLICNAGAHDEALEVRCEDLVRLEHPVIGSFAFQPGTHAPHREDWSFVV